VHGFWYPYRNIFRLVEEELRVRPFTDWCPSAQYSPNGLEVTSPIFQVGCCGLFCYVGVVGWGGREGGRGWGWLIGVWVGGWVGGWLMDTIDAMESTPITHKTPTHDPSPPHTHPHPHPTQDVHTTHPLTLLPPPTHHTHNPTHTIQDMPRLPTPLGTFLYTRFKRLPWADRARCVRVLVCVFFFCVGVCVFGWGGVRYGRWMSVGWCVCV
jgi:hypothetical protein